MSGVQGIGGSVRDGGTFAIASSRVRILPARELNLQTASDRHRETDYYQNWSEADFENIVNWRSHLVRRV